MRIGVDARMVYYSKGGIGQYILGLIEGLAKVDSQNEYLILQSRKDKSILAQGANFKRASLWTPSHNRLERWVLPLEISRFDLDVLHSPDLIPPFRRSCRSVITIHDLAFLLHPHFLTKESARYYGQINQAVSHADHIIAVSETTKRDAVRLLGVPERRITVIYEAASPIYRPLDKEEARRKVSERYGLEGDFILFVGTVEPRKNLPTLLWAYRRLLDDHKPRADLVVAGRKGWLFEEVFDLTDELELADCIHFLRRVPASGLLYLYNAARLLVLPSFYEGFGLPPLEAMACGTPVVVSNVSALPEVVGDAGLLVDPKDASEVEAAIWRVLTDEKLRAELVERGLKRAQCFSWKRAARETLGIYRLLAE